MFENENTPPYYKYGRYWVKVFYHNISSGFFTRDECKGVNSEGKFNIIHKINELFIIDGVYEFMIEYPEHGNIVWQQRELPTNINKTSTDDVAGLKIIKNKYDYVAFAGLSTSNRSSSSCFDADKRHYNNYRYSIGTISLEVNQIPGPLVNSEENIINVNEVYLWVRVPAPIKLMTCHYASHMKTNKFVLILSCVLSS